MLDSKVVTIFVGLAALLILYYGQAQNSSESYSDSSFDEEYDGQERETKIFLLIRPLEKFIDMKFLSNFTSLQHWAIGCNFGNRAFLYELAIEQDEIKPSWNQWNMDDFKGKFSHAIKLGLVLASPKGVRDLANKNPMNGKRYKPITKNSQDWAEWMLKEMDPGLIQAMKNHEVKKISETPLGKAAQKKKQLKESYSDSSFDEEYDGQERETKIFLLIKPLEKFIDMKFLSNFTSLQHWAIGCDFGNRASLYELAKEQDEIQPSWNQWNMDDCKGKFSHVIKLKSVLKSPKGVRDLANKNPMNGQRYKAITNNCQDWAEWVLKEMDPELIQAMKNHEVKKISETPLGKAAQKKKQSAEKAKKQRADEL